MAQCVWLSSPARAAEPVTTQAEDAPRASVSAEDETAAPATTEEPSTAPSASAEPAPPVEPRAAWEPEPLTPEPEPATTTFAAQDPGEALPAPRPKSPFDQGRIRVSLALGWAATRSTNWLIIGVGGGYYILNGLELGADAAFLLGGNPFIATLTPGVRYTFNQVPILKPYVGTFYRHYFIADNYSDSDSLGARLGVNFMTGTFSYVGIGAVYEHFLDDSLYENPDQFYPELAFSFAF